MKYIHRDILAVISIITTALLVLHGFSERIDINLTDDTGYMVLGIMIRSTVLVGFGPLYSIMFKVIQIFTKDTVIIYDVAMHLMYITPPVVSYIMMRAFGLKTVWALLISTGFLLSPNIMSFITWSKISHYTIIIVMLWVILAKRFQNSFNILFSLVVLTFTLGFIRPESHLSWYISTVLLMAYWWMFVPEKWNSYYLKRLIPFSLLFILFIGLTLGSSQELIGKINLLVNPMAGGRSNIAFAQQFSYNYCEWNGLNNFDWIQWRDFSKENFGEFTTLGEAFQNNPSLFIKHITYNIQQYCIKLLYGIQSIFFPPSVFKWSSYISTFLLAAILILRVTYVRWNNWWAQFKSLFVQNKWIVLGLIVMAIPSIVASIIFYTREHYLLLVMPLALFILTLIFLPQRTENDNQARIITNASFVLAILLIFVLKPSLSDYRTYDVWEEYTYPSNRKTIEAIRAMEFEQEIKEVDHEGGLANYVGKNFNWVNIITKEEIAYEEYEREHQPNFYYVTKALLSNRFMTEDTYFMDIINHPEEHGFHRINLQEENKGYLLVSDTLKYKKICKLPLKPNCLKIE